MLICVLALMCGLSTPKIPQRGMEISNVKMKGGTER